MLDLKQKAAVNEEDQHSEKEIEAKIVELVLGYKSGYIKGIGHGVKVPHASESNVFAGVDLKKKLLELDNANEKLADLTPAHARQSEKISKLERQMAKMTQLLRHITGNNLDGFLDDDENSADN